MNELLRFEAHQAVSSRTFAVSPLPSPSSRHNLNYYANWCESNLPIYPAAMKYDSASILSQDSIVLLPSSKLYA